MPFGRPSRPPGEGAHTLAVAATVHEQRLGTAAWLDGRLAAGTKVFYKIRPDGRDWLVGPTGPRRAPVALATGQLEVMDLVEVVRVTGGTTEGLRRLHGTEVARGLDEGWPRIGLSQESPGRPMADAAEATAYAAQESVYDELARRAPVVTRCQLTSACENRSATWETAALHCDGLVDTRWRGRWAAGRWELAGEIDVHVVACFSAAVHGALRRRRDGPGDPDLHVDVARAAFDLAGARSLLLAARAAARDQGVVLHGAGRHLRDVVAELGCPCTVRFVSS